MEEYVSGEANRTIVSMTAHGDGDYRGFSERGTRYMETLCFTGVVLVKIPVGCGTSEEKENIRIKKGRHG